MAEEMRTIKPKRYDSVFESRPPKKKIWPKVSFDLDVLPEARKWKIGGEYKIVLRIRQVGLQDTEYSKSAEFDIRAIKVLKNKS